MTLGVARLQRLVHVFEGLDQIPDYDEKRKVLLATAPGEQHSLGSTIVQKFLRAAGWHVWTCATPRLEEAADIAAKEWFGVVGFSLSSDLHLDSAGADHQPGCGKLSLNPKVGIMVGGSAIARIPMGGGRGRGWHGRQRPGRGDPGKEASGRPASREPHDGASLHARGTFNTIGSHPRPDHRQRRHGDRRDGRRPWLRPPRRTRPASGPTR